MPFLISRPMCPCSAGLPSARAALPAAGHSLPPFKAQPFAQCLPPLGAPQATPSPLCVDFISTYNNNNFSIYNFLFSCAGLFPTREVQWSLAEPKPDPKGTEALPRQGSFICPSPNRRSLRTEACFLSSQPLGSDTSSGQETLPRDRAEGLPPPLLPTQTTPLLIPPGGSPLEHPLVSVNLLGSAQQLEMDGQEAVTMDERPSVPRWVGAGEAGNRGLPPRTAGSGWREAWDDRACGVCLDSPRIRAGSPSQMAAQLVAVGCRVQDVCDKNVGFILHCLSPGPSTGPLHTRDLFAEGGNSSGTTNN